MQGHKKLQPRLSNQEQRPRQVRSYALLRAIIIVTVWVGRLLSIVSPVQGAGDMNSGAIFDCRRVWPRVYRVFCSMEALTCGGAGTSAACSVWVWDRALGTATRSCLVARRASVHRRSRPRLEPPTSLFWADSCPTAASFGRATVNLCSHPAPSSTAPASWAALFCAMAAAGWPLFYTPDFSFSFLFCSLAPAIPITIK
jgi:hypothetical protein